jgi:hypothetical protein
MDVGGGMARIEGEHLPKATDGLVVLLLAPGDVAELAQALDVAGLPRERGERALLVDGRDAEGELDAFILRIESERLPILARALLELTPPVREIPAEDVPRDARLRGEPPLCGFPLSRRIRGRELDKRPDVVREEAQLGEILLHGIVPGHPVELDLRVIVAVEPRAARREAPQRLRSHREALEQLPRARHVDLVEVSPNGGRCKARLESAKVDPQRLPRADEQRVALEAVEPERRVGIDGLEGAGDHLQADVVDLVVGQPLHEDPVRRQHAPAQLVELPRVEVTVACVLGIERVDRYHVVGALGDQEEVPPVVDRHAHPGIREDSVIHLGEETRGTDHVRHELHDVDLLERGVAAQGPHGAPGAEPDHQRAARVGMEEHRQVREELLDLGVVVDEGHVQVGRRGPGDRPSIDAQELPAVRVGRDLHHASGVLRVVQHLPLRLAGDVREPERRYADHHGREEREHQGVGQRLSDPRDGA